MTTYDTSFLGDTDNKLKAKTPFTVGWSENKGLIEDEKSRLATREAAGMPTSTAASVSSAAMGTGGSTAQTTLADRLKAIAAGGPSAGQQQVYQNADEARRANMAAAFGRAGGGANVVAGLRGVGNQNSLVGAQAARQASIVGAQEQQAAMNQYAQLGSAMRGADIAESNEANKIGMANAGFQQQSALANQDAALRWQAMNDAQKRALLGMGIDGAQSEWDNKLGYYGALRGNEQAWLDQRRADDQRRNQQMAQGFMSAATMGAGGAGGKMVGG